VTIGNATPSATSVAISPSVLYTDTDATAVVSGWSDADGDAEGYQYAWYVNGSLVTGANTATLSSSELVRDDTVYVVVTPDDGTSTGSPVTSSTKTVANTVPVATTSTLSPTTAYEETTLTCTAGAGSDGDGDAVTWTYAWTVSGGGIGLTTSTLPGDSITPDDTVSCTATPPDGTDGGVGVTSNTVTIRNTLPVLASAVLTPSPAYESSTLACAYGTATDVDLDSVSYTYAWRVNSATLATTTATLGGAEFASGDSVVCLITPNDGTDDGVAVASNAITVANTAPTLTTVGITPTPAFTDTPVYVAESGWSDEDGDSNADLYQWYVNGAAVTPGGTFSSLSDTAFVKDDEVYVVVTPFDGTSAGVPVSSSILTIDNLAPSAPVVMVTPTDAEPEDDLLCTVTTGSTDVDGDAISYVYSWTQNAIGSGITTNTVDAAYTDSGDTWVCTVTPFDGDDYGSAGADAQQIVDLTSPDQPVINATDLYRNETEADLDGTAEAGSTVTVYAVCTSGTSSYTTIADASGFWATTATFAQGDVCSFYAYAVDGEGNLSPMSNTVSTESCDPYDSYEDSGTYGDVCTDPVDAWFTLDDDGLTTLSVVGNALEAADEDWYAIHTSQSVLVGGYNLYHFEVNLVSGSSDYTFEVFEDSCGSTECGGTGGYTEYEVYGYDDGTGGTYHLTPSDRRYCYDGSRYNNCEDLSGTYYIHVMRNTSTYDCTGYELEITNGVW
jgi:hypothetical protein